MRVSHGGYRSCPDGRRRLSLAMHSSAACQAASAALALEPALPLAPPAPLSAGIARAVPPPGLLVEDVWALYAISLVLLDAYFASRNMAEEGPLLPAEPNEGIPAIMGLILSADGSAPGLDNRPYEVYHYGVVMVAAYISSLQKLAHRAPILLKTALGPNSELRVWIPKKLGADRALGQRP